MHVNYYSRQDMNAVAEEAYAAGMASGIRIGMKQMTALLLWILRYHKTYEWGKQKCKNLFKNIVECVQSGAFSNNEITLDEIQTMIRNDLGVNTDDITGFKISCNGKDIEV